MLMSAAATLTVPTQEQLDALAVIVGEITVEPHMEYVRAGGVVRKRPRASFYASVSKFVEMRGDGFRRGSLYGEGDTEDAALADLYARATAGETFLTVNGDDPKTGKYGEQNYGLVEGVFVRLVGRAFYPDVMADLTARRAGR